MIINKTTITVDAVKNFNKVEISYEVSVASDEELAELRKRAVNEANEALEDLVANQIPDEPKQAVKQAAKPVKQVVQQNTKVIDFDIGSAEYKLCRNRQTNQLFWALMDKTLIDQGFPNCVSYER